MAGMLPGESSHHGTSESGPSSRNSQEKPEESGARWYFSRKEIEESSPSRRDGIDLKKETYLRKSYCTFLQDLGMRLKVSELDLGAYIILLFDEVITLIVYVYMFMSIVFSYYWLGY
ncbi:hypothetical protein Patl1_11774 [Pistacia atlantica]|uniref:Uncharacterized protein n=1 Tax=Pistacia atlantica TaxID=434234 RepID=A0ACC1A756_9ROSI|nr:hypothetical protein Patl1_11774 [Pistacia atlantica]